MFLCLSFFHVTFHPEVEFLREGSLLDFLFRVKHEMNDSLIMRLDNTSGFLELSLLNITFPDWLLSIRKLLQFIIQGCINKTFSDRWLLGINLCFVSHEVLVRDVQLVLERITPVVRLGQVSKGALEAARQELLRHI